MNDQDYLRLLLEAHYAATTLTGLQMEEQRCLALSARRDIPASAKLPKVREDIRTLGGILMAQQNMINSKLQKDYEFKFKSIKVTEYDSEGFEVQEQNNNVQRSQIPQQEGSQPRSNAGLSSESNTPPNESSGRQVTMASPDTH